MSLKNIKSGFSLVELMIFFLFITILLAASTPIITKRIKNVPLRAYHGKFLCYRDTNSGTLIGEYYNSTGKITKRVESNNGTTLEFIPPKRAAIYKIDMIGAGAGGYDYFEYEDEVDPNHTSYFNKYANGEHDGDTIYKLSDDDIKKRLQGKYNTIKAWTGKGGDAGDIVYSYPIPSGALYDISVRCSGGFNSTKCYYYDVPNYNPLTMSRLYEEPGEGGIYTSEVITPKERKLEEWLNNNYPDDVGEVINDSNCDDQHICKKQNLQYTTTPDIQSAIETKLQELILGNLIEFPVSSRKRINGGKGGEGAYITYTYQIDFNSPEARGLSADEYIKSLMEQYQSGSSSHRADEFGFYFSAGKVRDGHDGTDKRVENGRGVASAGGDASGYGALKIGNNLYLTNYQKAMGAGKTEMNYDSTGRLYVTFADGVGATSNKDGNDLIDSDGNIYSSGGSTGPGFSGTSGNDIKYVELVSTVPIRTYHVGASGESAKPLTRTFTTLGKSCTITIPPLSQGDVVFPNTTLTTPVDTEFVCEGWKKPLIALSGTPAKIYKTDSFSPYQNQDGNFDNTGFVVLPDFYKIAADVAAETNFGAIGRIFTKLPSTSNYGQGGNGVSYEDKCLKMGGEISIYTKSNGSIVDRAPIIDFPYDSSCKMSNNKKGDATPGGQGAIIISW